MEYYDIISQDLYDLIISKLELFEYEVLGELRRSENYYNIINNRYSCIGRTFGRSYDKIFYEALLLLESQHPMLVNVLKCRTPGDKIEEIKFIAEFLYDYLIARQENYGDIIYPDSWRLNNKMLNTDIVLTSDSGDVVAGLIVRVLFNYRYPYILDKYKEFGMSLDSAVKMMILYANLNNIVITESDTNYDKILKYYINYKNRGSPILPDYDFDFEDWLNYGVDEGYATLYKKYGILKTFHDEDSAVENVRDLIPNAISSGILGGSVGTYLNLFIILEKDFRYNPVDFESILILIRDVLSYAGDYTDIIRDKLLQKYPQYQGVL